MLLNKINNIKFIKENITIYDLIIKLLILSILAIILLYKGFNLSIEFTGGILVELNAQKDIKFVLNKLENLLKKDCIKITYKINKKFTIILKIPHNKNVKEIIYKINYFCKKNDISLKIAKLDFIGAEISQGLFVKSLILIIISMFVISIYIGLRFGYKFSLGSLFCLLHDLILLLTIFFLFHIEFNLAALSSIIAVLGYSINNTIVIFDRIRTIVKSNTNNNNNDNVKNLYVEKIQIVNSAIKQTLKRTILTSTLTLVASVILLFFGGDNLLCFSFAFTIGIIIGTYSSLFVSVLPYVLL